MPVGWSCHRALILVGSTGLKRSSQGLATLPAPGLSWSEQALGKSCVIITHTRGVNAGRAAMKSAPSAASVKAGLLLKLLRRQFECCAK